MPQPRLHLNNAARQRAYRWRKKREQARQHTKVYHRSLTTEWATPPAFYDALDAEFHFDLDVCAQPANAKCARFFTPQDDGLSQRWEGVCWLNPPYGKTIGLWIHKASESALAGATVVCLVPARTDTRWWQTYVTSAVEVRFVPGRLRFGGAAHCAPFPNAVLIFRPPAREGEHP